MPRGLSKTRLMSFLQCPKQLWLQTHRPDLAPPVDAETQALFETGHTVGAIARQTYEHGAGAMIGYDAGLAAAMTETERLLRHPSVTPLFEATFQRERLLVRTDGLERGGRTSPRVIEVKASTRVKDVHVTGGAAAQVTEVPKWLRNTKWTPAADGPRASVGTHCSSPYVCPYAEYCWPKTGYPLTDLPGFGRNLDTLVARTCVDVRDVPIRTGTRPYRQPAFQWSLHVEKSARGEPEHAECLDLSGSAPMRHVAERLVDAVGPTGPVFMYTSSERQCPATLADCCPDLAARPEAIGDRLADLQPIIKRHYCHPDMHGSWSIKSVLPTVAPHMDCAQLDEIHDGGAAQRAYLEAIHPVTLPARRSAIRDRLLRDLSHDALAMVRLARWCQWSDPTDPTTGTSR